MAKKRAKKKTVSQAIAAIPVPMPEPIAEPVQVRISNRRQKRNTFFADAVRDESDRDFLNAEIGLRKYKGKLKTVTTIKHIEPIDGEWITEFIIDLK